MVVPFDLCKFCVFYLIESALFISSTNAAFSVLKSADDSVSQKFKIAPIKNESRNEIQITGASLHSTEYMDSLVNNHGQANESFETDELPWEKENSHHYYYIRKKVDSNEMQMIYWYYDKLMAVILGIFFGITLNLENAKAILKQPIGPSIGIFCKFVLSPFVSFYLLLIPFLSFFYLFIFYIYK